MCFSATASFITGAGLCVAGCFSLSQAKNRSQAAFAAIPIVFGIQQFSEGVIWLSVNGTISEKWLWPSALVFLFFAQVFWPAWVSASMLSMERITNRRIVLRMLLFFGIALAIYHVYCLIRYPIAVSAGAHHIDYQRNFPDRPGKLISTVYLLVTIVPFFVSSIKGMKLLGTAVVVSCLTSFFFYREFFISTWCFFAAIVSVVVIVILVRWNNEIRSTTVRWHQ